MYWGLVVVAIVSYLIGSINLSIVLCKIMGKGDIRDYGSGNAGTTNTLRVLGKGAAVGVLLFDILKAVIAIGLAKLVFQGTFPYLCQYIAAFFAILGHNYPIYYGFRGGKGIATSLGAIIMIDWQIGLACLIFALVLMALTRFVSLGSIMAAILFPILVIIYGVTKLPETNERWYYIIFAILISLLAIWKHRTNIKRLLTGTENKLSFKK